jgi:nicotinamide mononucleotide transporter
MKVSEFIAKEFSGWGKFEKYLFPLSILVIIFISIYLKDNKIALVSAICGVSYTILAGKGKISCYFFGLCGTLCYAFIAFKNMLLGNCALYALYYLPMQILGIFKWKKHLKSNAQEIIKTTLTKKERLVYSIITVICVLISYFVLIKLQDKNPCMDSITTIFSILGLILTVKRCIEQWFVWFVVNGISMFMWIFAYLDGSNCFATILMWFIYWILAVYFYIVWKKELNL